MYVVTVTIYAFMVAIIAGLIMSDTKGIEIGIAGIGIGGSLQHRFGSPGILGSGGGVIVIGAGSCGGVIVGSDRQAMAQTVEDMLVGRSGRATPMALTAAPMAVTAGVAAPAVEGVVAAAIVGSATARAVRAVSRLVSAA